MLLIPHQREVGGNQRKQDARDEQHVCDVEAVQHDFGGEVSAEDEPVQPGTNDGQGQHDGGHDAQANTREQVIRKGISHEAFSNRK